jgi:cephalosporin-C deacetylase-like acetyl esterase
MQPFQPFLNGYYSVANQLSDDLHYRARQHGERRAREKAELCTIEQVEAYRAGVRENFLRAIGGLPGELAAGRTPLNSRVTGTLQREGFDIQKIIYESLPGFLVTAACYLPHNLPRRAPAVVMLHGHAEAAKGNLSYQRVCCDLAANGFVVLAIDPIGQGERCQYLKDGGRYIHRLTFEHSYTGYPYLLAGQNFARLMIWDVVRGIDYLETRPDVDAGRIGMTGASGGGTQTCYLMMTDPRVAAAVPCTFVSSLESIMNSGKAQDMEQIINGAHVTGPDHDDFVIAMAPRPVCLGIAAYDYFPYEGADQTFVRARAVYELYGKPGNIALVSDNVKHTYSAGLRQDAVNWFKVHLKGEAPDFVTTQVPTGETNPFTVEPNLLWCTQSGQVLLDYPDSKSAADLISETVHALPEPPQRTVEEARRIVDETLRVSQAGDRNAPIRVRYLDKHPLELPDSETSGLELSGLEDATWEHFFFLSTADVAVSGLLLKPTRNAGPLPATLLLLEDGTNDIEKECERILELLRSNQRVFVFDVRGTGGVAAAPPSANKESPQFPKFYMPLFKFSCDALQLDLTLLGLRVFDVLRAIDHIKARGDVQRIALCGVGHNAATAAYFAAVLEPAVQALTVEKMLYSYRDLCYTHFYDSAQFDIETMPPGQLQAGDFVDFLPCLAEREINFVSPLLASGQPLSPEQWQAGFIEVARERGYLIGDWQPGFIEGR